MVKLVSVGLLVIFCVCGLSNADGDDDYVIDNDKYVVSNRTFPNYFKIGTASAAYQIEGAWDEDGKGESIWDHFTHSDPTVILDQTNGDIACDAYHKTKEDVALMKDMGIDVYRFSIAWSRILPTGYANETSEAGINYYKDLIAELKVANIEPLVTMYHWDLPQQLQDDFGGFLSEKIGDVFVDYARILFKEFGDDVKYWVTFNEPKQTCAYGYGKGDLAPGIDMPGVGEYICSYNLIKAHAKAYHLYDEEFRSSQQGKVSMVIDTNWYEPATNSSEDKEASERGLLFTYGWYAHPIFFGNYPQVMIDRIANRSRLEGFNESRLPEFTEEEQQYINNTADYLCINIYTSSTVKMIDEVPIGNVSRGNDMGIKIQIPNDWEPTGNVNYKIVPWGARKLLNWLKKTYNDPEIFVTENGYHDDGSYDLEDMDTRGKYHKLYLSNIQDAIYKDGVNVTGYTAWSLYNDWEWKFGWTTNLGFYYIDYTSPNRTRIPKASVEYFKHVCHTKCLIDTCVE